MPLTFSILAGKPETFYDDIQRILNSVMKQNHWKKP